MARNLVFGWERTWSEVEKCPKCNGEMVQGEFLKNLPKIVVFPKEGRRSFERVIPNYGNNCGFTEIKKEAKKIRIGNPQFFREMPGRQHYYSNQSA